MTFMTVRQVIAQALDALDTSANDEHARGYMDGCPENMTDADVAFLLAWLDANDTRAAAAVRAALATSSPGEWAAPGESP